MASLIDYIDHYIENSKHSVPNGGILEADAYEAGFKQAIELILKSKEYDQYVHISFTLTVDDVIELLLPCE